MAITISGSGITSANIADGTIVNADVADLAAVHTPEVITAYNAMLAAQEAEMAVEA